MKELTARYIIAKLGLAPLPAEGGFFRRTFQATGTIPGSLLWNQGDRYHSTAIYYLVTPESFSTLHRLPQDEIFHFYRGDAVEMIQIGDSGKLQRFVIGPAIEEGQAPQVVAPGRVWQGTRLLENGRWALLGCTVSPGFDYRDHEVGTRDELLLRFPQHAELVRRFTAPPGNPG